MEGRVLDFVALGILCFVVITIIYGIIFIHDIPYTIAKKRNHPHMDAIHTAGWVSLFLMHTIWPFLWIWATLYKPGYGWGVGSAGKSQRPSLPAGEAGDPLEGVKARIIQLEQEKRQEREVFERRLEQMNRRIEQLESGAATGQQEG